MRKTLTRLTILLLLVCLVTSSFAGCAKQPAAPAATDAPGPASPAAPADEGPAANQDEGKVIRFAWWGGQTRNDQTMQVVELFKDEHPGVGFECEFASMDDHFSNLSVQIAAGKLPDLIQHDYRYIQAYVENGLLAPLDEFIGREINVDSVAASNLEAGIIDGKLYGFNVGNNAFGLVYVKELFEQCNIPIPDPENWDYEDFVEVCRAFKEHGIYGCELSDMYNWAIVYLRSNGAHLYSQTEKGLGYDDDKLMENLFQMRLDLVEEGLMPSPDVSLMYGNLQVDDNLVTRGQAAMMAGYSNNAPKMAASTDYTYGMLPMFGPGADQGSFVKPSQFFTIAANSENKELCAQWISLYTNSVEANNIMKGERGVPISSEIRDMLKPSLSETEQNVYDFLGYVEEHSSKIDNPDPSGGSEVQSLLNELDEEVLYKVITPAQAAARFREEAAAILLSN